MRQALRGCIAQPLGVMPYIAIASPAFVASALPRGLSAANFAQVPFLVFNRKDDTQVQWVSQAFGVKSPRLRERFVPSSEAYARAACMGWGVGVAPELQLRPSIEAGQLVLAMEEYSVGDIVATVLSATESLARTKGLQLGSAVAQGLPVGTGDARRLTQVLLNLVGNAIKFTDQGSVEVRAALVEGRFEMSVVDTGFGIAPDDQKRIFEEFQQVDNTSTRKKGGTGLGLSISRRIVEDHGGGVLRFRALRILAEAGPGRGRPSDSASAAQPLVILPLRMQRVQAMQRVITVLTSGPRSLSFTARLASV